MSSRSLPTAASQQPTLFHGSLNYDFDLRYELNLAINASGLSRAEIAARMSDYAASRVTEAMLDAWTAPSRAKWNIPVRLLVAFDVATNSTRLLDLIARKHGRMVLTREEALDAELGALARQEEEIRARRAHLLSLRDPTGASR